MELRRSERAGERAPAARFPPAHPAIGTERRSRRVDLRDVSRYRREVSKGVSRKRRRF